MIQYLQPPLPVTTTKGKALAYFLIDQGPEWDLMWVCFLDRNGECWTFRNRDIRAQMNITQGRDYISPFYNIEDTALKPKKYENDIDEGGGDTTDEVGGVKQDCEDIYNEIWEEKWQLSEDLKDWKNQCKIYEEQSKSQKKLLKDLLDNDQIYFSRKEEVELLLKKIEDQEKDKKN